MLNDKLKDLALELAIFGFGLFALIKIVIHLSVTPVRHMVNFSTLPIIYSSAIVVLIMIKMIATVRSISKLRREAFTATTEVRKSGSVFGFTKTAFAGILKSNWLVVTRIFGTIVLCMAYAFLLHKVNFFILSAAFLVITFLLYGIRSFVKVASLSIGGAALGYIIFVAFLKLPL